MILDDRAQERRRAGGGRGGAGAARRASATLLALPPDLGRHRGARLTDPVWFMIADWFAIYLVGQRLQPRGDRGSASGCPSSPPTSATSSAAASSSALIRRGWSVGRARKRPDRGRRLRRARADPGRASSSTFPCSSRASRSRPSPTRRCPRWRSRCRPTSSRAAPSARWRAWPGPARGRGHASLSTYLIGVVADRFSFTPILIVASLVPLVAAARGARCSSATPPHSGRGLVKAI